MNLRLWTTNPKALAARVRYLVWEVLHPGSPWLCPGTVRFCERRLKASMRGLEFGSGQHGLVRQRVGRLTSVEHHPQWYQEVLRKLSRAGLTNVDYRLISLDHPEQVAEQTPDEPTPAYVRVAEEFGDHSLDFVVVDGHYRDHCIRRAVRKLRAGGYLLVDDVNFWPKPQLIPVPRDWQVVDDSTNGLKRCLIWQAAGAPRE